MVQPSVGAAAPFSLRIVQKSPGESLIVALPFPSSATMLHQSSLLHPPAIAAPLPTLNRAFWTKLSYSPAHLAISTVLRRLGLRQVPNSKRIVFQYNNVIQLADAVAEVVKKLPTDLKELIDAAADFKHDALDEDIAHLLYRFGNNVWGAKNERPWLLQANEGVVEYQKDLVFGDAADQEVMVYYIRLWIFLKAFNYVRKTAQPRAKNNVPASLDEQSRRTSTRRAGGSSVIPEEKQSMTPGSSFAATVNPVATPAGSNAAPAPTSSPMELVIDSTIPSRRTARTPKPRKYLVDIDSESDESANDMVDLKEESDEPSRYYKGKGRAWKKIEADEDPAFVSKENRSSSKQRTSNTRLQATPRPRGRPPKRLMNETLSAHVRESVSALGISSMKGLRRPRRKNRSEGVIDHSSDESEDNNNIYAPATKTAISDEPTPKSREPHGGKSARQPPGACESCRRRRQKCDRGRPYCGRCVQLGFTCSYITDSTSITPVKSTPKPKTEEVEGAMPVESKQNLSGQLATNGDIHPQKIDLPLDEGWDEERWRDFYLRGNGPHAMVATMRSLGLNATPKKGDETGFVVENYVSLCKDICQIAGTLCNEFSGAELISFAADPSYLDEEIDIMFDNHSHVWSVDADRTNLLAAGSDLLYPKDLSYEDDDDRKLLWIHLHRWVFIVAISYCKRVHGAGARNMNKVISTGASTNTNNQRQLESVYSFESPEGPGAASQTESNVSTPTNQSLKLTTKSAKDMVSDLTLRSRKTQLVEAADRSLEEKQIRQQGERRISAAESESNMRRPARRQQKRKDSSIATPEQSDATRPHKQRRVDRKISKPDDFTALFTSYLRNFVDPEFDELAGLTSIEGELPNVKHYASGLDAKQRVRLSNTVFTVTFPAWLAYRREIVESKRKMAAMPPLAQAPSRQVAIMERNRLATHLRKTHETFLEAGCDDLRAEQVIYRAVITLLKEHGNSHEAEDIRRGFARMEEELTMLGDQLMKDGGAKYVMGGAASVAVLKDMHSHARIKR